MKRTTKNIKDWMVAPRPVLGLVLGLVVALASLGCTAEPEESPAGGQPATEESAAEDRSAQSAGLDAEGPSAETEANETARPTDKESASSEEVSETVAAQEESPDAESASDGAGVTGTVTFDGPRPKRKTIKMSADKGCVDAHGDKPVGTESELVSAEGKVANVFVYVKGGESLGAPAPTDSVRLVQKGCMYSPRVMGVQVGQKFEVENADRFIHNVRGLAKKNRPFNFGQPTVGVRERVFKRVELPIKIRCDIHPWMVAFIFVTDHPFYAVTDREGNFSIADLPAGEHTIVAVHEKYGVKELKVTVIAGGAAKAEFTYTPDDIKPSWR